MAKTTPKHEQKECCAKAQHYWELLGLEYIRREDVAALCMALGKWAGREFKDVEEQFEAAYRLAQLMDQIVGMMRPTAFACGLHDQPFTEMITNDEKDDEARH